MICTPNGETIGWPPNWPTGGVLPAVENTKPTSSSSNQPRSPPAHLPLGQALFSFAATWNEYFPSSISFCTLSASCIAKAMPLLCVLFCAPA